MKTIDLGKGHHSLSEVLALAKTEPVLVHLPSGDVPGNCLSIPIGSMSPGRRWAASGLSRRSSAMERLFNKDPFE